MDVSQRARLWPSMRWGFGGSLRFSLERRGCMLRRASTCTRSLSLEIHDLIMLVYDKLRYTLCMFVEEREILVACESSILILDEQLHHKFLLALQQHHLLLRHRVLFLGFQLPHLLHFFPRQIHARPPAYFRERKGNFIQGIFCSGLCRAP